MARKVATSKQTGGGGFDFEDKVAAWFISDLLSNSFSLLPIRGKIIKIEFQVRPEGWLLDDILLTLNVDSKHIKIPFTVKSNSQFSGNGPNADLNRELWEQFLKHEFNVFDSNTDFLGIINSTLTRSLSTDLNKLIDAAKASEPKKLQTRVELGNDGSFSESQIRIFSGFSCPDDLAKAHGIQKECIWKLLSRLILLQFDFDNETSKDKNSLVVKCAQNILSPDGIEELKLCDYLCGIRKSLAPKEGAFINYPILLNDLRPLFKLKGIIDHENDWRKIIASGNSKLDRIRDTIGGKVEINQDDELTALKQELLTSQVVFLLGESGYGKSVLCKKLANETKAKFIWIDSDIAENGNIRQHFNLDNSIVEIIELMQDETAYLFIDGIDRFFSSQHISLIRDLLISASNPDLPWHVIISCQTDDYEGVLRNFYKTNITIASSIYNIEPIGLKNAAEIRTKFTGLEELFKHSHLERVLNNLKYLDLLAYHELNRIVEGFNGSFGESNIIDLIWMEEIENCKEGNGDQRSLFLQLLASDQANLLKTGISTSKYEVSQMSPVTSLKNDKIIYGYEDKLYFGHDLFGDWARYKLIRSNNGQLKPFLLSINLLSPLWAKAIRLYGVFLLEKNDNATEWENAFSIFNKNEPKEKIIQDLLLEAILFTSSTIVHLESLWTFFKSYEGEYLRRFLGRFLIKATRPNEHILQIARELGGYSEAEASTYHKTPIFLYWPPLLLFLKNHIDDVVELSRQKLAIITQTWLIYTPLKAAYRNEAAVCALKNAQWIFDFKLNENSWITGDEDKLIYSAFLSGVNDLPDEVVELSLKLCRRLFFEKPKEEGKDEDIVRKSLIPFQIEREQTQWKDGPSERVDRTFSEVCLNSNALNSMILIRPSTAKEIILALLIAHPAPLTENDSFNYKLDINEPNNWFPPIFSHGPFLYFLETNSEVGISLILELVNFATLQWQNVFERKEMEVPSLNVNIGSRNKVFIGDENVYFWYRNGGDVNPPIPTALMALEKFLIDQLDSGNSISSYVDELLKVGNSVAYLGLLSSIGRYKNELFVTDLKPLLRCFELYDWEKSLDYGGHSIEGHQMIGSNFYDKQTQEKAKIWNSMPHRKFSIVKVAIYLYLGNTEFDEFYREVTEKWKAEMTISESKEGIDVYKINLVAQFNKDNYNVKKEDGRLLYEFNEPQDVKEKLAKIRDSTTNLHDEFTLPYKYYKDLEENQIYSIQEIESLYSKIQSYITEDSVTPKNMQIIFGALAVLASNRNVWKEVHPDYDRWILTNVKVMLEQYTTKLDQLYMVDIDTSWQSFCAKILSVYWVEDLINRELRTMISLLITKSSYDVTEKLFIQLSKKLNWSEDNFVQLQNFVIEWSSGVYQYYHSRNNYSDSTSISNQTRLQKLMAKMKRNKEHSTQFNIDKFRKILLKKFIRGRISKSLLNWSDLRLNIPKTNRHSWSNSKKTIGRDSGLLIDYIHHAFSSLPNLAAAKDKKEYNHILLFWNQVVEQVVFEIGEVVDGKSVYDDYPNKDFQIWAIKGIAKVITELDTSDNNLPEDYWKPIFEYGRYAPHFVENLIVWFFIYCIDNEEKYPVFYKEWDKMKQVALESSNWEDSSGHGREEVWETLMGLSHTQLPWWDDDKREFFKPISEDILNWLKSKCFDQDVINALITILRKKSGGDFIKAGVPIISKHLDLHKLTQKVETPKGYTLREFRHNDSLAKTISYLWQHHIEEIKFELNTFNCFKSIILYLVSIQNPIGIELQMRIIQD